jgi:hypothetical protein|tara:strand:- start:3411 stop:3671 length:261 start_codon:yes stop_codon:yes gene_type:complete
MGLVLTALLLLAPCEKSYVTDEWQPAQCDGILVPLSVAIEGKECCRALAVVDSAPPPSPGVSWKHGAVGGVLLGSLLTAAIAYLVK